jgi:molybdopterin/thiamine biosynthesis adenylyltransferase
MDLVKHLEFFDPINDLKGAIHIIGVGAIGSTVAEMLARTGVPRLYLYDFDEVSPHNITNQMFFADQIKKPKLEAIAETLQRINPDIELKLFPKGYIGQNLSGYVFLCVDNIDLRRKITEDNMGNENIKAMFDFRMRLTDAQHYAADWADEKLKQIFLDSMQFTSSEAKAATPTNACGSTLNIIPTVRIVVSCGIANFINFIKEKPIKKCILIDAFNFMTDTCEA